MHTLMSGPVLDTLGMGTHSALTTLWGVTVTISGNKMELKYSKAFA